MRVVVSKKPNGKTLKAIETLRQIPYGDQLYTGTGTSVKFQRDENGVEHLVYFKNNKIVLIERIED